MKATSTTGTLLFIDASHGIDPDHLLSPPSGARGGARSRASVPMWGVGRHRVRYSVLGPRPATYYGDRLQPLPQTREMLLKTDFTELVGLRVRRLRQERGWTQRELLARIDGPRGGRYSPGLLSRVENGFANPPIFVYVHVAEALETAPERLMGDEDVQRPVAEAELTLLRYLRAIGMRPHEALARLAPDPGRGGE